MTSYSKDHSLPLHITDQVLFTCLHVGKTIIFTHLPIVDQCDRFFHGMILTYNEALDMTNTKI